MKKSESAGIASRFTIMNVGHPDTVAIAAGFRITISAPKKSG